MNSIRHIPNTLTILRLCFLPAIIACFYSETTLAIWICFALYVLGAITDFLDGWIARRYNCASEFGKFLDPIADKVFVATILLMLVASARIDGLWVICVVIILMREFLVAGLREYLGPKDIKLPVTQLAKWKTTFQMIAIGFLIVVPAFPDWPPIGLYLLALAALLTLMTGWIYLTTAFDAMRDTQSQGGE